MDNYPPYVRCICLAKRAELAFDLTAALGHLADALRLTREPGDVLQIERWAERIKLELDGRQRKLPIFDDPVIGKRKSKPRKAATGNARQET